MNSGDNWDNYSHQRLYDWIHGKGGFYLQDGAGVSGAAGAQDGWAELAGVMARARERTEAALAKAGAVWEGDAADAMRSGVTPLAQWADDAHTASTASQSSTDIHVSAYSGAKNQMPEPVPVTSTANGDFGGIPAGFTHLFGGQTDQDKQEAAAQDAKAEAVRVMAGYEGESGVAQAAVGRFVPPPSVTVNVVPSQAKGGDVIPVGVSEWPGSGKWIDDTTRSAGHTPGDASGPDATPPPGSNPPPGSKPAPGSISASGSTSVSGSTTPSAVTTAPLSGNPVTTGLSPEHQRVGSLPLPTSGFSTGGTPGERDSGSTGGGGSGGAGRGPSEASPRARAGTPSELANERVAGRSGAAGTRGANGMGTGPAGNRAEGEEDKEHQTAEYLRDFHDGFWDDSPPVAPSVIGDEEDD